MSMISNIADANRVIRRLRKRLDALEESARAANETMAALREALEEIKAREATCTAEHGQRNETRRD